MGLYQKYIISPIASLASHAPHPAIHSVVQPLLLLVQQMWKKIKVAGAHSMEEFMLLTFSAYR
jgi:hypothetical protein